MEQRFKKEKAAGIKERLLTSENTEFIFDRETANYRYVSEEFFNPTPTIVYGNKAVIMVWEPPTIVMIENSELADSYRKHFEMLWHIASEKPKTLLKKIKI